MFWIAFLLLNLFAYFFIEKQNRITDSEINYPLSMRVYIERCWIIYVV